MEKRYNHIENTQEVNQSSNENQKKYSLHDIITSDWTLLSSIIFKVLDSGN